MGYDMSQMWGWGAWMMLGMPVIWGLVTGVVLWLLLRIGRSASRS